MQEKNFTEADWKLFRKKIPVWQETYMEKLNREYIRLLSDDRAPSEKFWELDRRIKEDKQRSGVRLEMTRSALIGNIAQLIHEGVINMTDLEDFSDTLKDTVHFVCERIEKK